MATTATTPSELILAIDTTIRQKVTPNSITPETHSGLLDNIVDVLSGDTYTNAGVYDATASTINFTTTNSGVTYSVSGITDNNTFTTGGTYVASASTITFEDNQGGGYAVTGINEMQYLEVDVPVGVAATSGILGLGSVPIELLPAGGANTYYEYKGVIEYSGGTTGYVYTGNGSAIVVGNYNTFAGTYIQNNIIEQTQNLIANFSSYGTANDEFVGEPLPSNTESVSSYPLALNESVQMFTWDGVDPTTGDGTIKVKIWYTLRTFG